jgi:hypothetical protein
MDAIEGSIWNAVCEARMVDDWRPRRILAYIRSILNYERSAYFHAELEEATRAALQACWLPEEIIATARVECSASYD